MPFLQTPKDRAGVLIFALAVAIVVALMPFLSGLLGAAVLYVFTTSLHSGVLGALLTFAPRLWYPIYDARTAAWGLSALEDQQLAGLLMWIPGGAVHAAAALAAVTLVLRTAPPEARHGA